MTRRDLVVAALMMAGLAACSGGPPEVNWNADACDFCRMTISERQYATAATTATGRTVRFDAIECLAGWVKAQPEPPRAVWVTDAETPGTLIPVARARFFRSTSGHSPMGKGFVAVAASHNLEQMKARYGEGPMTWEEIQAMVGREGATPAQPPASH